MATRTLTYLDIPLEIRRESAARARVNIRSLLINPVYTQEQKNELLAQLERITMWEVGQIPVEGATPPAPPVLTGLDRIRPV